MITELYEEYFSNKTGNTQLPEIQETNAEIVSELQKINVDTTKLEELIMRNNSYFETQGFIYGFKCALRLAAETFLKEV